MRRRLVLATLALSLVACQSEVFPDAPTMVPVASTPQPTASPSPTSGVTPAPQPPHTDGQLVKANGHYLEFVPVSSSNNQGRIFFAFFAYMDESVEALPTITSMSGTMALKDNGTSMGNMTLKKSPSSGEPFLYLFPTLKAGHTYEIHAELTVDDQPFTGDFSYLAK